jgi:hypothetical protein
MALNPDILSEIKYAKAVSEPVREFLLWAVTFEERNLELELPSYKKEYSAKLDELIQKDKGDDAGKK